MRLSNKEAKQIIAGANVSASLLNALMRGVNIFLDTGRYLGSSIRRWVNNGRCPLK